MNRSLLLVVLCTVLVAVPELAGDRAAAFFGGYCCLDISCCVLQETLYPDTKQYGSPSFVRQKANGKCVYDCPFTEDALDIFCDGTFAACSFTSSDRFRIGPYDPGACPSNPNVCGDPSAESVPPGGE